MGSVNIAQLLPGEGCIHPEWVEMAERLERALVAEDWRGSARAIRQLLEKLLLFFTSVTAGLVQELEQNRPELEALAHNLSHVAPDQLVAHERLLRFSLSVLRTINHPVRDKLISIFIGDEPPLQGRWLQLNGPSSSTPPPLSALDEFLQVRNPSPLALEIDSSRLRVQEYLPILLSWLSHSRPFFEEFEEEADEGQLLALASPRFRFQLLPALSWEAAPRPRAAEWSEARLRQHLEQLYPELPEQRKPHSLMHHIRSYCQEERRGYILLKGPPGAGKSLVARSLMEGPNPFPVVHFPVRSTLHSDFQTFIEVFDERLHSAGLRGLGHRVTRELNIRYPADQCSRRLYAYLSGLLLLNGSRILIILDGLDEVFEGSESQVSLSDFLPPTLPEGIFMLLTCQQEATRSRASRKLRSIEEGSLCLSLEPGQAHYRQIFPQIDPPPVGIPATPVPLALLDHLQALSRSQLDVGQPNSTLELYNRAFPLLEERGGSSALDFLLALASLPGALGLEEILALQIPVKGLLKICEHWPTLLRYDSQRASLKLSHEELRHYLLEHYAMRYFRVCRGLALVGSRLIEDEREDFDKRSRLLERLHGWMLDSQDMEVQGELLGRGSLKRLRDRICNQLETEGRFHAKLSVLAGYRQCLQLLVARSGDARLREELAWAHNSRGLTYLRLGQFQRSLEETERATEMFRYLIEKMGCEDYRSGLAAALNRQSEAHFHLGTLSQALQNSQRAIQEYREVVEERKQSELRHLLALALVQRARCFHALQQLENCSTDLNEAVSIYTRTLRFEESDTNLAGRRHLQRFAEALVFRAENYLSQGSLELAQSDLRQALERIQRIPVPSERGTRSLLYFEFDGRMLGVQALELQAVIERKQGRVLPAILACDEALRVLQEMLDEGRLDVRDRTAQVLAMRGQLWSHWNDPEEAQRSREQALLDWTRAIAHLSRLIEFEGYPGLHRQRAELYLLRARHLRASGREAEAVHDFEKGVEDLERLAQESQGRWELAIALAHQELGALYQKLGEESRAVERLNSALQLLQMDPQGAAALTQTLRLRARSLRRQGQLEAALADYNQALAHFEPEMEMGSPESLRDGDDELAHLLQERAEIRVLQSQLELAAIDYGQAVERLGWPSQASPDELLPISLEIARGELLLELEDFEGAMASARRCLKALPSQPPYLPQLSHSIGEALDLLARALISLDAPAEEVLTCLERAREVAPQAAREWMLDHICRCRLQLGQGLEAAQLFLTSFTTHDADEGRIALAHSLSVEVKQLGIEAQHSGQLARALEHFQAELALLGWYGSLNERADCHNRIGWCLLQTGQSEQALAAFEQTCLASPLASEVEPATPARLWAYKQRGLLLERLGRSEDALEVYDIALNELENTLQHEEKSWFLRRQSHLFESGQRQAEAVVALSRAIELERSLLKERPRKHLHRVQLAQCLVARSRISPGEASRDLREALPLLEELEHSPQPQSALLDRCRSFLLTTEPDRERVAACLLHPEGSSDEVLALCLQALAQLQRQGEARQWLAQQCRRWLEIASQRPQLQVRSEALMQLAQAGLDRELQAHMLAWACSHAAVRSRALPDRGYPQLIALLHRLGQALQGLEPASWMAMLSPLFSDFENFLSRCEGPQPWDADLNNMVRVWQTLTPAQLETARISRATLQTLRRW